MQQESADSTRLRRWLRVLRAVILAWLVLLLGPMLLRPKELLEPRPLAVLFAWALIPAVVLHLGALFTRERPGLSAVGLWGGLLFLFTVGAVHGAMVYSPHTGWWPILWAGSLALVQLAIVVAAGRAWLLARSPEGPGPYLAAVVGGLAPFVIWVLLAPMHGWSGHGPIPRNEATMIGDIRTIISAQAAYSAANGGFYDVPPCLASPHRCIPAYPASQPTFLDSQLAQTTAVRNGYRRVFHPGPPAASVAGATARISASSLLGYALVGVPLIEGETGVRGFCGDASGALCFTTDGRAPGVESGACTACEPLH